MGKRNEKYERYTEPNKITIKFGCIPILAAIIIGIIIYYISGSILCSIIPVSIYLSWTIGYVFGVRDGVRSAWRKLNEE